MPAPVQVVLSAVFTTHQPTHGCTLYTGSVTDQTDGKGTAVYVMLEIELQFAHGKPFDDAEAFLEISWGNVMQKIHLNKEKSDASKLAKLIDSTTKQLRKSYEQQKMPPLVSSAVASDGWPIQVNLYLEDGGTYTMVGPSEWQNTASAHIMIAMAIGDTVKSCAEMELYGVTNTQCNVVPIARICIGKHVAYLPVSWVTFEEVPSYLASLGNQIAQRLKCLQDWHASDILNLYLEDAQEQDTVMKQPSLGEEDAGLDPDRKKKKKALGAEGTERNPDRKKKKKALGEEDAGLDPDRKKKKKTRGRD